MMPLLKRNNFKKTFFAVHSLLSQKRGSILVYIIVVMLIFAVLGTAMVSLFSTSISSSATANESRRAFYLAESGLRYGLSELRKLNGFSTLNIATLNDTLYKMPPSGDFDITVFGAWFFSPMAPGQKIKSFAPGNEITLQVEKGKIPAGFIDKNLPAVIPNLYIVNVGYDLTYSDATAQVTGPPFDISDTSFKLRVSDDFKVNENTSLTQNSSRICLAVKPLNPNSSFTPTGDSAAYLDLDRTALNIFPKTDGCFLLKGIPYFYKTAKDDGTRFTLYNISLKAGTPSPVPVDKTTDYIILAPNNYFITSKGSSGTVTYGGDLDNAVALYDHSSRPLIADLQVTLPYMRQIETGPNYISDGVDASGKEYMKVGGISGSNLGAMWFKETINYGGATDYCSSGECFFKSGIRVFFTLEYSGSGDGLIFSLINGALNSITSIGGDVAAAELLGYSGDGRLNANGTLFIPGSTRNLNPPKIGLEFDTKINFSEPPEYCFVDPNDNVFKLKENTRNDPGSNGKDMVQYVFWGDSSLNIPCRRQPYCGGDLTCEGDPSYDDNRHDAGGGSNPINDRDLNITSYPGPTVGGTSSATQVDVELESDNDWLKGKPTKDGKPYRPQWAVRMEVWRDICGPQPCTPPSLGTYILKTWLRQCKWADCRDVIGYFFEDTRIFYSPTTPVARPAQLVQTIGPITNFDRFIFGFTSQTGAGDLQTATIRNFKLSFIHPGDPFITDDPDWP
jgi:hypothetical protein